MQGEVFTFKKRKHLAFHKSYMKVGVKKLLRAGVMLAKTWGSMQWGCVPRRGQS